MIKRQGLTRDLPPGKEQWMWGPTSATLISGQRDAVLVDALLTVEQAHALSSSVAKGRWPRYTAGPRRRGKPKHSHRGHPVPGPGNVAAKRCVVPDDLERGTRRFRPAVAPEASDSELQLEFDRFPIRPLSISAGTDLLASPRHGLSRADCGEPHTEKV